MTLRALVLLCVTLAACGSKGAPPPPAACTKFGDRCEYAPGKLGSCVEKPSCADGDCFVCQSQH